MSDTAASLKSYDPRDPDPWLALVLDQSLPMNPRAKAALARDMARYSRQFLLPLIRPFSRGFIIVAQLFRIISPRWPQFPRVLHHSIAFGMRYFLSPEANELILRHFHLGAQILRFISDNATPGFHPRLEPMQPQRIDDVKRNLFLNHDLNIYNFLIQLNEEMSRRGVILEARSKLDFSAITEGPVLDVMPSGRLNCIDIHTAVELYTPAYAFLLSDRDFWRASNSLQLDETIGLYAARLTGEERHLALVRNGHPLVPISSLAAGFRLMLHGLSTEMLHAFLLEMKRKQERIA